MEEKKTLIKYSSFTGPHRLKEARKIWELEVWNMSLGEFLLRQLTFARVLVGDGGLTSLEVRTICNSNIAAIFEAHLNLFLSRKM